MCFPDFLHISVTLLLHFQQTDVAQATGVLDSGFRRNDGGEQKRRVTFSAWPRHYAITPSRRATATACVRLCASSFVLMLRRCVRIVLSDTNSFSAIALFE